MHRSPALGLIALLLGCTSWRMTTRPLPELVENQQPDRLRVTAANGARMVVHGPQVVGDTLAARIFRSGAKAAVHVPWSGVRTVELRRLNAGKTFLLVTGVALVVAGAVVGATLDLSVGAFR